MSLRGIHCGTIGCSCHCAKSQCSSGNRKHLKKLPKQLIKIYTIMFLCFFSSSFSLTILFPFVPFMVEFLLPWLAENEELVATYVGFLVSAPYFGRLFGSYIWGAVADHKGRRPIIIISLLLIGLSAAIFGFSVSFEMAVILRFLAGLFNGVVGACKAVVSEVSDDSTQALGVTMLGTAWLLGIVVGPALSGVISDPLGQYNLTIEHTATREFLMRFPYSPPCLLSALLCAVSALLCVFMLKETLGMTTNKRRSGLVSSTPHDQSNEEASTSDRGGLIQNEHYPSADHTDNEAEPQQESVDSKAPSESSDARTCPEIGTEPQEVIENEDSKAHSQSGPEPQAEVKDEIPGEISAILVYSGENNKECEIVESKERKIEKLFTWIKTSVKKFFTLLRDKSVLLSLLTYSIFSSMEIAFNEIYAVWAKTSPHLGGPGLSLSEIGITLTVSSVLLIPVSLVVFPLLERKLGLLRLFYFQAIILIPTLMLFPNVHYVASIKWLLWILLCSALLVINVCFTIGFNCSSIFINNSVTFDKLGAVNGMGTALAALIRAVFPLVAGRMFSLSLLATAAGLGYPLDYRLLYLVFGIVILVCVLLTACLPVSINKQKVVEDVNESSSY